MSELRSRILDATAELLGSAGLRGVNTNAIARAAGCSVGSVYVYFRNKEDVLTALLSRYGERLLVAVATPLAESTGDWRDLVRATVGAFAEFYRTEPGYRELWLGAQLSDDTLAAGTQWGATARIQFAAVLQGLAPELDAERAQTLAEVSIYSVSSLVTRALKSDQPHLIDEAQELVIRYLEPALASGA